MGRVSRFFVLALALALSPSACARTVSPGGSDGGSDGGEGDAVLPPDEGPLPDDRRVVSLAMSERHRCVAYASGRVACWGDNYVYSLAGGGSAPRRLTRPTTIGGISDAAQVGVGSQHACARRRGGGVVCWGFDGNSSLGNPRLGGPAGGPLVQVRGIDDARALYVSDGFSCVLRASGATACWGFNGNGELGDRTRTDRREARAVVGAERAEELSLGSSAGCARRPDASFACWGAVSFGAVTADPAQAARVVPEFAGASRVALGSASNACAVRPDGAVACEGVGLASREPIEVRGLGAVASLAVGDAHACAVVEGGRVACWGANDVGQLGDGSAVSTVDRAVFAQGISDAVEVLAGANQSCAVSRSGRARCWGAGWPGDGTAFDRGTPVEVRGQTDAVRLAAGAEVTCALQGSGRIACWGTNRRGQLGAVGVDGSPTPIEDPARAGLVFTDVCVGGSFVCGVVRDRSVRCWGAGYLGDGTLHATRGDFVRVAGVDDAVGVSCEDGSACVGRANGAVQCWGENSRGQLGDGTTEDRAAPVTVAGLPAGGVSKVRVGAQHACAAGGADGATWCWGANNHGQLGDGSTTDHAVPVRAFASAPSIALEVGGGSSCVREARGVWCWGSNNFGELALPSEGPQLMPALLRFDDAGEGLAVVALGAHHGCGLGDSGAVYCWGGTYFGELGNEVFNETRRAPARVAGLEGAFGLAVGREHACVVRGEFESSVWCWGGNARGQLGSAAAGVLLVPAPVGE